MATPCAADLKHFIVIEALTTGKDSHGGMTNTWGSFSTAWAKIKHLSGDEKHLTAYGGQVGEAKTEFTIRHLPNITTQHRIVYGGKVYNIKHVNDYMEEHRFMIVTCDTGLNDGR